jgi:hypothetical protein
MWEQKRINDFLETMNGVAKVYVVNHNRDFDEHGEAVEGHTHVFLLYDTPRTTNGIAKIFGVETNFVEVIHNRVSFFRYLTHMDSPNKARYEPSEVFSNAEPYHEVIMGQGITDRELLEACERGEELSLVGVVSMTKIAMAQRLVQNRSLIRANETISHLRDQNTILMANVQKLMEGVESIDYAFRSLTEGLKEVAEQLPKSIGDGLEKVATQIKLARVPIKRGR